MIEKKIFWDFNVKVDGVLDNTIANIIDKCVIFDEN